jgi:branched-chain amino acid transport system permease protein
MKNRDLSNLLNRARMTLAILVALIAILSALALIFPIKITLTEMVQLAIAGILSGGVYAVAAVGLAVVFGVMRIVNLAHGGMLILGSYITYWIFYLFGVDPFLALLLTAPVMFLLGVAIERVTLESVITSVEQPIIITFAILLIIESVISLLWSSDVRGLSTSYSGVSIPIGSLALPVAQTAVFLASVVSVLAMHFFLTKTYTGKSLLATSQDLLMAETAGIDTRRAYRLAFGLGSAYAGIAGTLLAISYAFEPTSGFIYLFKAFAVVVLAGLGSLKTLLLAGILLGLAEVFGGFILGSSVKDAISFIVFVLVLLIRPSGLAGKTQF